ncbi:unnamed protein product [Tuber melanosporum]|jgi:hypothetical protein|uniref:Long chronological lifespan protein 2 n=1 Tax=Tuber melanosporum (strain Mel28) TaxID=656061 RepID=D5GPD9_TUBMM|nr:uncharacterized protein GSTUM_00011689001 [Tuber melanosporum]CAZ86301.1 unnamed protein product [Tuber melanosporum]
MFGSSSSSNQRERGNVPSDSSWYRQTYDSATCSNYLCPGTLACVDKPTHCPCAWPGVEEKFELDADGIAVCLSRSGRAGFVGRKVDLARKGLL